MSVRKGTICNICHKEITDINDYKQVPTFDEKTKIPGFTSYHVSCIKSNES